MRSFLLFVIAALLASCNSKIKIDSLFVNGTVYTVDSSFSKAEAVAVKDGKIVATGTTAELQQQYDAKETVDLQGKFMYPGFIDAHAHFYRYGLGLQTADLTGTVSWEDILHRLSEFNKGLAPAKGDWIIGRGWDQNDWTVKEFPTNEQLNRLFPDNPVLLTRVDGHAAVVNDLALQLAGITAETKLTGGDVFVANRKPTGVLIDNAIDLVSTKIPPATAMQIKAALMDAQRNCFAAGLTTIVDCGIDYDDVLQIEKAQASGDLKMRLYVMLSDAKKNYDAIFKRGKIKTDRLNVRSFKVYGDGALGSRGACLLEPYSDKAKHYGFLLSSPEHFDSVAAVLYKNQFQMCTHAIGDSGNRTILNIYGKYLQTTNDLRWRIEHAQVVNENDFALFGKYSIVPSVQPTHATSDMYWAEQRLGPKRVKGAYAFNDLLKQNGWIPLGTDFPVEDIDPLKTFYAAVFRKDTKGWPAQGYQTENALTREATLRGMTIWAARSNFEENEKGSIENGKFADFVVLDTDLMTASFEAILKTTVLKTISNGETVFSKKN
ncbi:amidohydrolase [Lacibacter luteus]|uniref:Amidohydrolase n=1 Tax=Lacibacter luteus TaxID=2508719 RepID=A0A4Q1CK29_9BACT|nr:amidohydrolase [Lacibacter luteus]